MLGGSEPNPPALSALPDNILALVASKIDLPAQFFQTCKTCRAMSQDVSAFIM